MHMVAPGWGATPFLQLSSRSLLYPHCLGLDSRTPAKHLIGVSPQEMLPAVAHCSWLKRAPTSSPDF